MKALILLLIPIFLIGCLTASLYQNRADNLYSEKKYSEAITWYKKIDKEEQKSYRNSFRLGLAYEEMRDWENACIWYKDARTQDPKSREAIVREYNCLIKQKKDDEAITALQVFLENDGDFAKAYTLLAGLYFDKKDYNKAVETYRKGILKEPSDAMARASLGAALIAQRKYSDAVLELRKAVSMDSHNPLGHYNLGIAFLGAGRAEEAAAELSIATELDPKYPQGWIDLCVALVKLGHIDQALETLKTAKQKGFTAWEEIRRETDLKALVADPRFEGLTGP